MDTQAGGFACPPVYKIPFIGTSGQNCHLLYCREKEKNLDGGKRTEGQPKRHHISFPQLALKTKSRRQGRRPHDVQFAAAHPVHQAYKYRPITAAVISHPSPSENTGEIDGKINFGSENELGLM